MTIAVEVLKIAIGGCIAAADLYTAGETARAH
jgi:hypothetical protein